MAERVLAALKPHFDLTIFPLQQNASVRTIGKFALSKLGGAAALIGRLLLTPSVSRADLAYVMPAVRGFAFWRDFLICEALRRRGLTRVLHMHAKGVAAKSAESPLYRRAARRMFDGAHVIHLSPIFYQDVAAFCPPERFHVVENGMPPPEDATPHAVKDVPTIFFLSNLMRTKGPLELLAASRRLMETGVRHRLVFAGSGSEAEVTREIAAAANALEHVTWLDGVYDPAKLATLWAEADIFALPTNEDCQPLVVIEAMARGKAIVTTREGSLSEMLEDGVSALLVAQRDAGALSAAIERLIKDREYRDLLGKHAYDRYSKTHSLPLFQNKLVATLSHIIKIAPAKRLSHTKARAI